MKKCRQCSQPYTIGLDGLCPECSHLRDFPDATASRTQLAGVPFRDMKQIDETDRFKLIAECLRNNRGKTVAVLVENDATNKGKGDRYIAGVKALVPEAQVSRAPGLVKGTESLMFKL
jgi:hypothetical protein